MRLIILTWPLEGQKTAKVDWKGGAELTSHCWTGQKTWSYMCIYTVCTTVSAFKCCFLCLIMLLMTGWRSDHMWLHQRKCWMDRNEHCWSHVSEWSRAPPINQDAAFPDKLNGVKHSELWPMTEQYYYSTTAASSSVTAVMSSTCVCTTVGFGRCCDSWRANQRGCGCGPRSWGPIKNSGDHKV